LAGAQKRPRAGRRAAGKGLRAGEEKRPEKEKHFFSPIGRNGKGATLSLPEDPQKEKSLLEKVPFTVKLQGRPEQ